MHHLFSSLTITGRKNTCTGEPLTFICEVHGPYLQWMFDSDRSIFFSNQRIDTVQTVSSQDVRAILTANDALTGESELRRLASALLIDTSLHRDSHDITCSSDTQMQIETFQTAGEYEFVIATVHMM